MDATKGVLVIGDPTRDQLIFRQPRSPNGAEYDWQRYASYTLWELPGGVALTEAVLSDLGFSPTLVSVPVVAPDGTTRILKTLSDLVAATADSSGKCTGTVGPDSIAPAVTDGDGTWHLLRVIAYQGYFQAWAEGKARPLTVPAGSFPIIVLNDGGAAARSAPEVPPILTSATTAETLVLHKMHLPLTMNNPLVATLRGLAARRRILIVTAADLRADGTRLRASLSWPMFTEDLQAAMGSGFLRAAREVYDQVVILVGEDGVFAIDRAGTIVSAYDAGCAEGDYDSRMPGDMYGKTNVFACALLKALADGDQPDETSAALAAALSTVRDYSSRCLKVATLDGSTLPNPPKVVVLSDGRSLRTGISAADAKVFEASEEEVLDKARAIVRQGRSALVNMEHARFGVFQTVDRTEIEGFRAIRSVIDGYVNDATRRRPMSLAVFGPPGAGKSFGISQLAKARHEIEPKVFNLSEASAEALPGYFHEMRDANLNGKVPLWFFDEFDSRGCELVARFLAPMQDGEMRDGTRMHPLGRGILVFAGGTAATAAEFSANPNAKALKIPDFMSRLAGIIDIRGINRVEDDPTDKTAYLLRRAVLLRSLLEQHRSDIRGADRDELRVHDDLLTALLKTQRYRHGARSMEKIVAAGALKGPRPIFGGSDLPDAGMLSLHLEDPAGFLAIATGGPPE